MPTPYSIASSTMPIASISTATACDEPDHDQLQRIDRHHDTRQKPAVSRTPDRATSCRNTERNHLGMTERHHRNQQAGVRDIHSAVLGLPLVKRRLADPVLAADIGGLHPRLL